VLALALALSSPGCGLNLGAGAAEGLAERPHPAASRTETCFSDSEADTGLSKICLYTCASGEAAITVRAHDLCPITIQR
jgi:hypothetical protein